MSGEKSWLALMKSQQQDLQRLELLDAELNENQEHLDSDINNILKKPKSYSIFSKRDNTRQTHNYNTGNDKEDDEDDNEYQNHDDDINQNERSSSAPPPPYNERRDSKSSPRSSPRIDDDSIMPKAPEAASRFLKSKVNILNKQVEDGVELRKQLIDQVNDLQKQLKSEREENKRMKKKIQQLEIENKKINTKKGTENINEDVTENLIQEVTSLKKDLQTAERLSKQSEANIKSKDIQLKRATETITKLKSQLDETRVNQNAGGIGNIDNNKYTELENQVKILDKQKNELMNAFKKQLKLIDVLKRQKVSHKYIINILCI
jgi:hypothetical protein